MGEPEKRPGGGPSPPAGVIQVVANPVARTATVTFDPAMTTVDGLAGWIRDCGYHCRGESVPDHICPSKVTSTSTRTPAPAVSGENAHEDRAGHGMATEEGMGAAPAGPGKHAGNDMAAMGGKDRMGNPAEVMGHGGHGQMSMASMIRDMRNRFWSPSSWAWSSRCGRASGGTYSVSRCLRRSDCATTCSS